MDDDDDKQEGNRNDVITSSIVGGSPEHGLQVLAKPTFVPRPGPRPSGNHLKAASGPCPGGNPVQIKIEDGEEQPELEDASCAPGYELAKEEEASRQSQAVQKEETTQCRTRNTSVWFRNSIRRVVSRSVFKKESAPSAEDMPSWARCALTLPGFLLVIAVLSVGSCSIAFVLLPVSNPLSNPTVWQCALSCSVVWVPITILFVGLLLQETLYRPLNQRIPIKYFFLMWFVQSVFMSLVLIFLPSYWVNPAPMNGVFGATLGMVMNAFIIFFVFVPRLGEAVGLERTSILIRRDNSIYNLQIAAIATLLFFVGAVLQLIGILALSAFLLYVDLWYVSALALPVARILYLKALGGMAYAVRPEARVLGTTMAMVSVGIANAIAVGSAATWQFTLLFFAIDIAQAAFAAITVSDISICGYNLSLMCLLKGQLLRQLCVRRRSAKTMREDVPKDFQDSARHRMLIFLLAAELAEVIVAMDFSLCWLVVRVGPNAAGFSGNGTSDFGLQVPKSTSEFLANVFGMFCLEVVSFFLIKEGLRRFCGVTLSTQLTTVLEKFGPLLAAMSSWLIVTAFCFTMIHCGLDFSLEWDYL